MITKFGSIYAGHVDLDDIGLEGTPVNERWLSDERLATVFDKTISIAQAMDGMGYDTFWGAEHHFQREGYECNPNLPMLFVHLASLTKNIKLGCAFNVTPMWHPLRLAEDYAMADILTGGRVIFGVGRGYHSREVDTFGVPSTMTDSDANRERFEEQIEIIFKAFNSKSFSHHGKYYDIPPLIRYRGYELENITLVPRPRNLPVECWQPIVSASQPGMDLMAKHGIKGMIGGGAATGGARPEVVAAWRDTLINHGREAELGTDLIIGYTTYIADSREQAIEEASQYFEENLKMFGPLGFVPGLTPQQIADLGDRTKARSAGLPTVQDAIAAGSWKCGTAEQIIEHFMKIQAQ